MKGFPILYKYNKNGKSQQWQIFVKGDTFYTEEGLVGGTITRSLPTECVVKNAGQKNATTAAEQAEKEAASKYQKKLDKGYSEDLQTSGKTYFSPMLAEDYRDKDTLKVYDWVKKVMEDKTIRKFVQPKLDGLRSVNEKNTLMSREGKPFVTCPHLLQNEVLLDGELYNHQFKKDFNAIVSMIKQSKPTKDDIEHAEKYAEMWVYDFPAVKGVFSKRYAALMNWWQCTSKNPAIKIVPTYEIHNEDELKEYHKEFLSQGFEGTIIRTDTGDYENSRSKQLIKYKDFIDKEFTILGAIEGKGGRKGTIGKFILEHDKYPGETFKCNVKGKFPYLRQVWIDKDKYIGKEATVQFFNRTPRKEAKGKKPASGDVPRFGYVIKIDRKAYE